jgi:hypothetical protein
MDQQAKPTETQPQDSQNRSANELESDPTQICWTQVLRANEPDVEGPPRPLPRLPNVYSVEDLFR